MFVPLLLRLDEVERDFADFVRDLDVEDLRLVVVVRDLEEEDLEEDVVVLRLEVVEVVVLRVWATTGGAITPKASTKTITLSSIREPPTGENKQMASQSVRI